MNKGVEKRRNSAFIPRNDPRVNGKLNTAPVLSKKRESLTTDSVQRCKSASLILQRLKSSQSDNSAQQIRRESASFSSISTLVREAQKKERDEVSKLPSIRAKTSIESKLQVDKFQGVEGAVNKGLRRPSLPSTLLPTPPQRHQRSNSGPTTHKDWHLESKLLLSSAIRQRRASRTLKKLSASSMKPNAGRHSTGQKHNLENTNNSKQSIDSDISSTEESSSNTDESSDTDIEGTQRKRDESLRSNESPYQDEKYNSKPRLKRKRIVSSSSNSRRSESEDSDVENNNNSSKPIFTTTGSNSKIPSVIVTKDENESQSSNDDDGDDDGDDEPMSDDSKENDDIEVLIDDSLLDEVLPPGLPMLDIHEQVYLATKIQSSKDTNGGNKIRITKIRRETKGKQSMSQDEICSDIEDLIESIDDTTLLTNNSGKQFCGNVTLPKKHYRDDEKGLPQIKT